jgi:hypothetical protein
MTNGNKENRGISQLKGNSLRERQNAKLPESQQFTQGLPAEGDDFQITLLPDEPSLEDDEKLEQWLHNAHNKTEKMRKTTDKMRETIGKVLKQKRDLLASQGKASDGGWQDWVKEHCDFSLSTANRYIKAFTNAKELPDQETESKEKPIQAKVDFSDSELGQFYKAAKKSGEVKQKINERFEQATREVMNEYRQQAEHNGLDLYDHLYNLSKEKKVNQSQE